MKHEPFLRRRTLNNEADCMLLRTADPSSCAASDSCGLLQRVIFKHSRERLDPGLRTRPPEGNPLSNKVLARRSNDLFSYTWKFPL